jgi:hypothetical protein
MPWVKLDDAFPENDKISALADRSFRLHVTALCYCARNLTDGIVTPRTLKIILAVLGWSNARRNIVELVAANLWIPAGDGHELKDFHDYNPSAAEVKEQRRLNADRQRRHREARNAVTNALRDDVTNDVSNAPPSRPVPSRGLALLESPTRDADDEGTIENLVQACGGTDETRLMVQRTIAKWHSTEGDIAWALESCRGPGVRNRRRVALAELKKRGEAKVA